MIPMSIILYFVLGAFTLDKGMFDYGTPAICVGIILFIFEITCIKHEKRKSDDEIKREN
jgi:hypothetical protein